MPNTPWRVVVLREPQKVLERLPRNLRERLAAAIDGLSEDPRPPGCKRLKGYDGLYRVRVGDWRIVCSVRDDKLIVLVVEVTPRGGAYRDLGS